MIDLKHKIDIFHDEKMNQEFEVADHYINRKTKEVVWFVPPKVDGLYFIRAKKLFEKAENKRREVKSSKKEFESGILMYQNKSAVFDFFSLSSAGIILLFCALESCVNEAIEISHNTNYFTKDNKTILNLGRFSIRRKQKVLYSKERLLFLDIKTKINKVLPFLYNFQSPLLNNDFKIIFSFLKYFRDSLIHIKIDKKIGSKSNPNSVFAEMFGFNFNKLLKQTEKLIEYLTNNCKSHNNK